MMIRRLHILGASGTSTTTWGGAFAERLHSPPVDIMDDIAAHDARVVSGSLCGWDDVAIPLGELVVLLGMPLTDAWHGSVNANTNGVENGGKQVGTCTTISKRCSCGQHRMMRSMCGHPEQTTAYTMAQDAAMSHALL